MRADDYYAILELTPDATAQDVKRAYRRLAMRKHPDVNKASDAQEQFGKLTDAYKTLIDSDARRQYDARRRGGGSWSGRSSPGGARSAYTRPPPTETPEQRAAREERQRKYREANPMPEDLDDSFGSLFGDVLRGVGKVLNDLDRDTKLEDWLSYVETSAAAGTASGGSSTAWSAEDDEILRTESEETLRAELEDVIFLERQLETRRNKLQDEVSRSEELAVDMLSRARDAESAARRAAATERAQECRRDAAATRVQCEQVRSHLYRVSDRKERIQQRIAALRKQAAGRRAPGGAAGDASGGRRAARPGVSPDFDRRVDDDLRRLKEEMAARKKNSQ